MARNNPTALQKTIARGPSKLAWDQHLRRWRTRKRGSVREVLLMVQKSGEKTTWDGAKTLKIMGLPYQLVSRISSINSRKSPSESQKWGSKTPREEFSVTGLFNDTQKVSHAFSYMMTHQSSYLWGCDYGRSRIHNHVLLENWSYKPDLRLCTPRLFIFGWNSTYSCGHLTWISD